MNSRVPLTQEKAEQIYTVLESAGASPQMRKAFLRDFMSDDPPSEWRFIGELGRGGKFRYGTFGAPMYRIDCYPEDETPRIRKIIKRTNAELEKLIDTPTNHDEF